MLWLLRHAEAADGLPDDERPLTERGVRQAPDAAGVALARLGVHDRRLPVEPEAARAADRRAGVRAARRRGHGRAARCRASRSTSSDLAAGLGDVLLVGHDPSFSLTLHELTGAQARMRKGGLGGDRRRASWSRCCGRPSSA